MTFRPPPLSHRRRDSAGAARRLRAGPQAQKSAPLRREIECHGNRRVLAQYFRPGRARRIPRCGFRTYFGRQLRHAVAARPPPVRRFVKQSRKYASRLGAPLAIADKERTDHNEQAQVLEIIGDVEGRTALIVDDFTISGGTLASAADVLVQRGASDVYAAISHGVFSESSMATIDNSPIRRIFTTDSIETQPVKFSEKIHTVSIAPLLGEAIRRIHNRESVSVLFDQ